MTEQRFRVGIVGLEPGRGWAARAHVPALRALVTSRTPNDFGYRFGYRRQFALISVSYAKLQAGRGLAGSLITLNYAYLS
jgi:hypothetical protein